MQNLIKTLIFSRPRGKNDRPPQTLRPRGSRGHQSFTAFDLLALSLWFEGRVLFQPLLRCGIFPAAKADRSIIRSKQGRSRGGLAVIVLKADGYLGPLVRWYWYRVQNSGDKAEKAVTTFHGDVDIIGLPVITVVVPVRPCIDRTQHGVTASSVLPLKGDMYWFIKSRVSFRY